MMTYCYWSIALGKNAKSMETCIQSARKNGIWNVFEVLCKEEIKGANCYEYIEIDKQEEWEEVIYLETAISKLNYDYYVYIDPKTEFKGKPDGIVSNLKQAPLHLPIVGEEINPSVVKLYKEAGIYNDTYMCQDTMYIVKRKAIQTVVKLIKEIKIIAKKRDQKIGKRIALSYAMQMLCADPKAHLGEAWDTIYKSITIS